MEATHFRDADLYSGLFSIDPCIPDVLGRCNVGLSMGVVVGCCFDRGSPALDCFPGPRELPAVLEALRLETLGL